MAILRWNALSLAIARPKASQLPEPPGKNVIKRIELVNFMSHAHTVIEPAAGLTVLVGPNNCGKSAVVTALQILAHNSNSTYVRRHDEKSCEVVVETDDGHIIRWSRAKNGSPRYVIDGQDFDRLKGRTPEILDQVLRLPIVASDGDEFDIHFGQQKEPIFLLNNTGKAAAQFFASSSDAIRLVEMQSLHKSKVREAKLNHKRIQTEMERLDESIEILAPITCLESQLAECEKSFDLLESCRTEIECLEDLFEQMPKLACQLQFQVALVGLLEKTPQPPSLPPTEMLESLAEQIDAQSSMESKSRKLQQLLESVPVPPVLDDEVRLEQVIVDFVHAFDADFGLVQRFQCLQEIQPPPPFEDSQPLENLIDAVALAQGSARQMASELDALKKELSALEEESKQWVAANPICPTCGAATEARRLLERNQGFGCHG